MIIYHKDSKMKHLVWFMLFTGFLTALVSTTGTLYAQEERLEPVSSEQSEEREESAPHQQGRREFDPREGDQREMFRRWRDQSGDEPGRPGPPRDREQAREYLEGVMVARLSKALGLSDEESILLLRNFNEHRDETNRLYRQRRELVEELRNLLKSEDGEASADALNRIMEMDQKIFAHHQQLVLNPGFDLDRAQRARLYLFMHDFEEGMRRLVRQVHMQRIPDELSQPPGPRGGREWQEGPPGSNGPPRRDAFPPSPPPPTPE